MIVTMKSELPKIRPRALSPYICTRCLRLQQRQSRRSYSTSIELPKSPPPPPASGRTHLTNRRLISLHGPDSPGFLHGLATATVRPNPVIPTGFYASFLTATGRTLNDVFIYPVGHSATYRASVPDTVKQKYGEECAAYFIECDAEQASALAQHLKRYKLRAKLDLRTLSSEEWKVWSFWAEREPWTPHPVPSSATAAPLANSDEEPDTRSSTDEIGCVDARAPGMGRRIILRTGVSDESVMEHLQETPLEAYTLRRYLRGIPEGQHEIHSGTSLPQESDIDYMCGIDFRKGCYLGQELTIRTHHTGVVRKRILPCMLYTPDEEMPKVLKYEPDNRNFQGTPLAAPDANISPANKKGRAAGKWISGIGNIGLGLCRIEMMTDMVLTAEGTRWTPQDEFKIQQEDTQATTGTGSDESGATGATAGAGAAREIRVKAFVPDWVRSKTKVQKPQIRV